MPKQQTCFIEKLYAAIQNEKNGIVEWDPNGKGFIVSNLQDFTQQVLLKKFGIGRLDSFARKLNRHGFKRSKLDKDKIRFFHKYFSKESKNLNKIKKLSKQESLPKHIKLRLIRQERQEKLNRTGSHSPREFDIVNEILQTVKINDSQIQDNSNSKDEIMQSQQNFESDNDSYTPQEPKRRRKIREKKIKIQQFISHPHYLRVPKINEVQIQYGVICLGSQKEDVKQEEQDSYINRDYLGEDRSAKSDRMFHFKDQFCNKQIGVFIEHSSQTSSLSLI